MVHVSRYLWRVGPHQSLTALLLQSRSQVRSKVHCRHVSEQHYGSASAAVPQEPITLCSINMCRRASALVLYVRLVRKWSETSSARPHLAVEQTLPATKAMTSGSATV